MSKTIILGLGLSGLAYYDSLKDKSDVVTIEKNAEIGGYTRTSRIDRFSFDYTGHFLHLSKFKHPSEIGSLGNSYKDKWNQINKTSAVYIDGKYCDAPYQYNFGQLGIDHAEKAVESYINRNKHYEADNLSDFFRTNFGEYMSKMFFIPYNRKLLGTDLSRLDSLQVSRFFPELNDELIFAQTNEENNLNQRPVTYNSKFWYPHTGCIDILLKHFEKPKSVICSTPKSINLESRIITLNNNTQFKYSKIISSIPLSHLTTLINPSSILDKYNLGSLTASSTFAVHIGTNTDLEIFEKYAWIYVPDETTNVYRIGCYSFASKAMNSNSTGQSLYIELSGCAKYPINEALEYMLKHFNLSMSDIETVSLSSLSPAYVHLNKDSQLMVKAIKEELSLYGVSIIGRYGSWDYVSMEDCIVSAQTLAKT